VLPRTGKLPTSITTFWLLAAFIPKIGDLQPPAL